MRKPLILISFFIGLTGLGQNKLQPGFNGKEYAELLSLAFNNSGIPDSAKRMTESDPYHLEYRSPETGLMNQWTLYLRNDQVGVIDLRGTVNHLHSWMENFYAAMIPATGTLQLNDSTTFSYQFAADPRAMVHTGWAIGIATLAQDIEKKINKYYSEKQIKEFFVFGHSQGGALAFLLRSYLEYEKKKGHIPTDILFKTYCSAAPKVGNTYYAYDYDFITRNGWSYTVVNAADWVPETPFSVQTLTDFNPTNPFKHTKGVLKKQKLLVRIAGNMMYNKTDRKTRKAQKKFQKYLGHYVYKIVHKSLPQLKEPKYANGNNYMRAGVPVVLMPDEKYWKQFPQNSDRVFIHHGFEAYYKLLKEYYLP
jgi:hypothetical protein